MDPTISGSSAIVEKIYTRSFVLLFVAELTVFAAFYTLLPIIPLYIMHMGGSETDVGLLLGITGLITLFTAPLFGRAVDHWGSKRILLTGLVIGSLVATSFAFVKSVISFALPLTGRSFGTTATNTASRTLVFDIAPASRSGEAISTFMLSHNFAIAFGPAMGLAIMNGYGFRAPFFATAVLCMVSFGLVAFVREQSVVRRDASASLETDSQNNRWFVREALFPATIQFLLSVSYGSTIQFLAVMGEQRDINSYQVFFTVYAVVVIVVRFLAGRVSDRYGRAAVLLPSLTSQMIALLILSMATSLPALLIAAVTFGMGWGAAYPTLTALTSDRVDVARRGVAMGIFSSGMAFGSAVGSATVGIIAKQIGFTGSFIFTAFVVLIGLCVCTVGLKMAGELRIIRKEP
ncbi:MAG: MFS transporter [SAR202 cluster bacterium]|nr:MFS transporter [SAR202 cluster bacterium]